MLPKAGLLQRTREAIIPRSAYRRALDEGDVGALWRLWGRLHPLSYQPANWQEAEIQLHAARTNAASVEDRKRCYSHHWLIERSLPSMLPNELKPKAEQFRPKVVSAVGFAWGSGSALMRSATSLIEGAVHTRIKEMAADGLVESNPDLVRNEMLLTKNQTVYALFGAIEKLVQEEKARVQS